MSIITSSVAPGYELPEVACQFTLEHFKRGDAPTIHTDAEAAKREGLAAPVATGPQVAALIFRQLRDCFGRGWMEGGKCDISFRRPVAVTDFCVARGVVTAKAPENGQVRVTCDVWIENGAGDKVIAGTASGLVPA